MSILINIIWSIIFFLLVISLGIYFFTKSIYKLPDLFNKITPNIDEEKEIIRGNVAVSQYYGRIISAGIIGISIIIASSIFAVIFSIFH